MSAHPAGVGLWKITRAREDALDVYSVRGHTAIEAYNATPLRADGVDFNDPALTFELVQDVAPPLPATPPARMVGAQRGAP